MKKINYFVLLIGLLAIMTSCEKDLKFYEGDPQLTFEYPGVAATGSPAAWDTTANSIQNVNIRVNRDTTIHYQVTLIASGPQGAIPFEISMLDANSVKLTNLSPNPATSTINPAAISFSGGTIDAGRFIGTFPIQITHANLSSTASQNVIFLLLSTPSGSLAKPAENYRRVRITFTRG